MLSYDLDTPFKSDLTTSDWFADLTDLTFMDKLCTNGDFPIVSDDEETLEQLSEIIENPLLLENLLKGESYKKGGPSALSSSSSASSFASQHTNHFDIPLNQHYISGEEHYDQKNDQPFAVNHTSAYQHNIPQTTNLQAFSLNNARNDISGFLNSQNFLNPSQQNLLNYTQKQNQILGRTSAFQYDTYSTAHTALHQTTSAPNQSTNFQSFLTSTMPSTQPTFVQGIPFTHNNVQNTWQPTLTHQTHIDNLSLPVSNGPTLNLKHRTYSSLTDLKQYELPKKKMRQSSLDGKQSTEDTTSPKSVEEVSSNEKLVAKEELLCSVCGDNAVCLHYGARTCEGCKGFFKRTVQKKAKYVCLEKGRCPVDKRRRNRCQFCRFQKCLGVGMQREVVRMNTLKGRRGRLPSRGNQAVFTDKNIASKLVKLYIEKENKNLMSNIDNNSMGTNEMESLGLNSIENFYNWIVGCMENYKEWSENISLFQQLPKEDKKVLFESAFLELFAFHILKSMDEGKLRLLEGAFDNSLIKNWWMNITSYIPCIRKLCLDIPLSAHLEALLLFADYHTLTKEEKVTEAQMNVCSSLKEHINNTYEAATSKTPKLHNILGKLSCFKDLKKFSVSLLVKLHNLLPLPQVLQSILSDS